MTDLITRIRSTVQQLRRTPKPISEVAPMLHEAADELERLTKRYEKLEQLPRFVMTAEGMTQSDKYGTWLRLEDVLESPLSTLAPVPLLPVDDLILPATRPDEAF